jgi:large subunit ribosomal protein L21
MKYAVIDLGGKQFMVEEGMTFETERLTSPIPEVVFYNNDGEISVGDPLVEGVSVNLVKERDFTVKTDIGRFKSKSRSSRKKGHKQPMSVFKVTSINDGKPSKKTAKKVKKVTSKKEEKGQE